MIEAILWDNDGVLVDTEPLFLRANREQLALRGVELSREQFIELSLRQGRSVFALAEDRGASAEEVAQMKRERDLRYEGFLADGVDVLSGVRETLEMLHGRLPMAIVTSAPSRHFQVVHDRTGLLPYFEFALTPEEYDRHKPHPEPYLRAAERLGLPPEVCLVVEDTERGLRAAVAAGMRCCVIPHDLTSEQDFAPAHRVLESVREVPGVVEALLA